MAMVAVGIRLEREVWERHSAAAHSLGVPLGVYLRRRLDEQDQASAVLADLKSIAERFAGSAERHSVSSMGLLIEGILILRDLAGPQRARMAHKEVERRGLEPWR